MSTEYLFYTEFTFVTVDITWQDCPLEQFPTLNKDYKVKCKVIANPAPFVDWLKNDDKIETDDHYIIEADGLLIKNAQESDDGIYTCRAYNADTGSMIKRNIRVEVCILLSFALVIRIINLIASFL